MSSKRLYKQPLLYCKGIPQTLYACLLLYEDRVNSKSSMSIHQAIKIVKLIFSSTIPHTPLIAVRKGGGIRRSHANEDQNYVFASPTFVQKSKKKLNL